MGTRHAYVNDQYRTWQQTFTDVSGRKIALASKPGVFSHGATDPASLLLAENVHAKAGDVALHMNCGNGLLGAALALDGKAARIVLTDRNVLALDAAARTLSANNAERTETRLGHGRHALPAGFTCDLVAIRIPEAKLALAQLLDDALSVLNVGGSCYLAGATNEGVKSAANALDERFGNAATVATEDGHRLVRATKYLPSSSPLDDSFHELHFDLRGHGYTFFSRPGVFSWDHLDEATAILVDHMDVRSGDRILDLGSGYGVLGIAASSIAGATHPVTMVDVDAEAVRSAQRSAEANGLVGARVIGSDVAGAVLEEQFDLVVTNPPFHVGKSTDLSVPIQFIADAHAVLAPGGRLNLVANRTLPYEGAIKFLFRNIEKVHDGRRFKVLSAVKQP